MTREEITEKVHTILEEQLGTGKELATDDAAFTDLGADSLDLVEITMAVEEAFSLEIDDEDAEKINTVGKLVDYLVSKNV